MSRIVGAAVLYSLILFAIGFVVAIPRELLLHALCAARGIPIALLYSSRRSMDGNS